MFARNLLAIFTLGSLVGPACADGCKVTRLGNLIPEYEQNATIHWDHGIETLHVAARSKPSEESLWIIPIRADAKEIQAEPVEKFPTLGYEIAVRDVASQLLSDAIRTAGACDSGGFCCLMIGGCSDKMPAKLAVEHARVEKLGMVVTVISAKSLAEMEAYLDAQSISRQAAKINALAHYVGQPNFAFVCAWLSPRPAPVEATGLAITFPSPTIWFPMRASSDYTNEIFTVVYVRGFVKPAPNCDLPDLKCRYVHGAEVKLGVHDVFGLRRSRYHSASQEMLPYTRVTVASDPQRWNTDLELVPGTTAIGKLSLIIVDHDGRLYWIGSALLGASIGWLIPLCTLAKQNRERRDYLIGALIGAGIVFTIWCSLLIFIMWRGSRLHYVKDKPKAIYVIPTLGLVHFLLVLFVCSLVNLAITWTE